MKNAWLSLKAQRKSVVFLALAMAALLFVMLIRLGSLVGGVGINEYHASVAPVGWHGIYHQSLYLPLKIVRSVDFYLFPDHGATLIRLPNILFGILAVVSFAWLIKLWHGTRTAIFAGLLFACGTWTLHISRVATFDVLYLWAMPALLLSNALLQRYHQKASVYYGSFALWGLLLYVPGMVWLLLANVYFQRKALNKGWQHFSGWWRRLAYILLGFIWLPLLVINLDRPRLLRLWLGIPENLASPLVIVKHFFGVFFHLFIRGPQYPELWLDHSPVLDIFVLVTCLFGIFFYIRHREASRSRLLAVLGLLAAALIALQGPVGFSLIVPLAYIVAATGITYLLREWLSVFPNNPLARNLGIGLICLAVALSCVYNLRAYFIAWPHADATKAVFRYKP